MAAAAPPTTTTEAVPASTPAQRGARRRERTRAKLLGAARQVIGEKGVDAATIAEITERADVAFGSFYNHFASKDDLIDALISEAVAEHAMYVDGVNLRFTKPAELLANALHSTVHKARIDPLWGWLVFRLASGRVDLVSPLLVRLQRDVHEGIAAGQFAIDDDVDVVMTAIGGAVVGTMAGLLTGALSEVDEWPFTEAMLRVAGMTPSAARATVRRVRLAQPPERPTGGA